MSKGKAAFKQRDVTRAARAAIVAGLEVVRVEIEQGKVTLVTRERTTFTVEPNKPGTGWEDA